MEESRYMNYIKYIIIFVAMLVLSVVVLFLSTSSTSKGLLDSNVIFERKDWNGNQNFPKRFRLKKNETLEFEKKIVFNNQNNISLVVVTDSPNLKVYQDGELLQEYKVDIYKFPYIRKVTSKVIDLKLKKESDIKLVIEGNKYQESVFIENVFYNSKSNDVFYLILDEIFIILLNIAVIIEIMIFNIINNVFPIEKDKKRVLNVLSIFVLALSVWQIFFNDSFNIFLINIELKSLLEYNVLCLFMFIGTMLAPYNEKYFKKCINVLIIIYVILNGCYLLKIASYYQLKILIMLMGVINFSYICISYYNEIINKKNRKILYIAEIHIFLMMMLCIVDIIGNTIFAVYFRFLVYIVPIYISIFIIFVIRDNIFSVKDGLKKSIVADKWNKLVYRDGLTGLYNRTAYIEELDKIDLNLKEYNKRLAILMIDINDLKVVNDTLGHNLGDKLILEIAKNMLYVFVMYGDIYRIGGDEFVIIFQNINEYKLEQLINKLLKKYDKINKKNKNEYKISIAYGYEFLNVDKYFEILECVKVADEKMYINKKKIKNGVVR